MPGSAAFLSGSPRPLTSTVLTHRRMRPILITEPVNQPFGSIAVRTIDITFREAREAAAPAAKREVPPARLAQRKGGS
jgi:hypothetical protein